MFKVYSFGCQPLIKIRYCGVSKCASLNYLTINNMNPYIKKLEYAVRGPIVNKAQELEKRLSSGEKLPFSEVIKCNIGDCHAMGQQPLTFLRQVVALVTMPDLMNDKRFPKDAIERAKRVLNSCSGWSVGSYSQSTGVEVIRQDCAAFIAKRDNIPSNSDDIFLSTGASEAVKVVLQMMASQKEGKDRTGIMVPIPQYPLYSATNAEYNAYQIGYYLSEENDWGLTEEELERSLSEASQHCSPRAIVIINPGNPTGQVLTENDIKMVIKFAHKHNLLIMADEVYQFNVYAPNRKFLSFKKALHDLGDTYKSVQVASFMSASKGFMGECGFRGGYCELVNFPEDVKTQLYKCISARLCCSVLGQAMIEAIVNPPLPNEPSYELFEREKSHVLGELKVKGRMVFETMNSLTGFHCNEVQGAMYAFPSIKMPDSVIKIAKEHNQLADFFYCWNLLEETGVCVVPGSGFGQKPGTYHFRMTILPSVDKMKVVMEKIKHFHTGFMKKYK